MTDHPEALAREVARGAGRARARRLLLLDLDGTLAPLRTDPEAVRVPPRTLEALGELLRRGFEAAVVSGRPARDVARRVPVPGLRVFGGHGLDDPGHGPTRLAGPLRRRLAALERGARPLLHLAPGARVERKPTGIAFHDRGVRQRPDLARWRREVRRLLASSDLEGLEELRGRRVVELRPAGAGKGSVIERLGIADPNAGPGEPDASLVALGDDRTDEDMFRALGPLGLSVLVGRHRRSTLATRRLASPHAVGRFLGALVAELDGARHPAARGRSTRRGAQA